MNISLNLKNYITNFQKLSVQYNRKNLLISNCNEDKISGLDSICNYNDYDSRKERV